MWPWWWWWCDCHASSSAFRPLAPPPGIPIAPGLSHYLQDPMPASFPAMGLHLQSTTSIPSRDGPWERQPLMLSCGFPSHGMSRSQPPLAHESRVCPTCWHSGVEECPLVVRSTSHSSRVVTSERMQITTVFSVCCWDNSVFIAHYSP